GEILAVTRTGNVYKWTDPILSIGEDRIKESEPSAKLYPNPLSNNEALSIEFVPSFLGDVELSILDLSGHKISTYQLNLVKATKQVLNFKPNNDLTSGVYFLQISYRNGIVERHKFVVE
ncbi:MAG: T9SS type A sorting domain-containing protein, partial [Candidatus Kapaibacterium sp.]